MFNVQVLRYDQDISVCFEIRKKVFCEEQKIPENVEFDQFEKKSLHILLSIDGENVATGRITPKDDGNVHFSHIAVLSSGRKKGTGRELLTAMINESRKLGASEITVNAQTHAVGFYEKLGFVICGNEQCNEYIRYVPMEKDLTE